MVKSRMGWEVVVYDGICKGYLLFVKGLMVEVEVKNKCYGL